MYYFVKLIQYCIHILYIIDILFIIIIFLTKDMTNLIKYYDIKSIVINVNKYVTYVM